MTTPATIRPRRGSILPSRLVTAAGRVSCLDLGDLPLVVVAHGRPGPVAPGVSSDEADRSEQLAQACSRGLTGLSRRGRLVLADTGHDVHIDAPDVVVRAVRDVVADRPE
jgi:hypothetical protein